MTADKMDMAASRQGVAEADVAVLPCPFCGKEQDADSFHFNGPGPPPAYAVECGWCGARGGHGLGSRRDDHEGARRAAAADWNGAYERLNPASSRAALKALREWRRASRILDGRDVFLPGDVPLEDVNAIADAVAELNKAADALPPLTEVVSGAEGTNT